MQKITALESKTLIPIGYSALIKMYKLKVIPYFRQSYITLQGRGYTKQLADQKIYIYPKGYALKNQNSALMQLEFAIRYDGINLTILSKLFEFISAEEITAFISEKITGKYRRKIWFLYEFLTREILELPDLKNVANVNLLDPDEYYASKTNRSKRHAINNNLLGNKNFCPMIRKTEKLKSYEDKHLENVVSNMLTSVDASILARTTNYLYTKETKSSFGIEHVRPDRKRAEKFIELLEEVETIPELNKSILILLQNAIVDPAYQDKDYRSNQNYVGEMTRLYEQKIHYISPKPEDLQQLMLNFIEFSNDIIDSDVHPVIAAAIITFSFVFLHPFEDGNGRIHRFLIHYVLTKMNYAPKNFIFPVSAIMLKQRREYDAVLESFSMPLMKMLNDYELNSDGELTVTEESSMHYQYIDYTQFAEYLFQVIEKTINEDFREELEFIKRYDKTKAAIQSIIDMPDLKIDLIIRCISENNGVLGTKMRRTKFHELSDELIMHIEKAVNLYMLRS